METEIVVAIILFSIWRLLRPAPVPTGIALGLCTYARPDLAIWVLIALLYLFHEAVRTKSYKPLAMTATITALLYLPWLLFTTLYYGSPIPNTILAKNAGYPLWIRDRHGIWPSSAPRSMFSSRSSRPLARLSRATALASCDSQAPNRARPS